MPTLRTAAEFGANLIARRLGYEVSARRADARSEGFEGYVAAARRAGVDPNDWEEHELGWAPALPQVERFVAPRLRPDAVVVEVGPGTGRFSRHLAARLPAGHLRLVDHSPWMVAFLRDYFRANPRVSAYLNDGTTLPFADDGWADLVFSAGTLIALKLGTVDLYLREFARVLKPGGWAVFDYLDPETPEGWRHLRSQTPFLRGVYAYHAGATLDRVAEAAGLRVGERGPTPGGTSTYLALRKAPTTPTPAGDETGAAAATTAPARRA